MHCRHFNNKGKHVINECVEGFIHERFPWQMGHRLQLVVQEQLWGHKQEPKPIKSEKYGELPCLIENIFERKNNETIRVNSIDHAVY